METQKPLLKDEDGEEVDVHMYRSMIGSLMYLTSSRPDIMFAVCACARYQVNPKVSHLHVVKRIFRYLKGQQKLGLWYLKYSPFDLVAYTDSDYARASLDRKSTTGGCQFLRSRLISWQCKKQTMVANSITEAEYVAALSCCGQATVKAKTINGEIQLQALVDGKKIIITESIVRRDLQLEDAEGVDCLPNATIFEQLTLIGYKPKVNQKFNFSNYIFESMVKNLDNVSGNFLMYPRSRRSKRKDTEVPQPIGPTTNVADEAVNEEMDDSLERAATTATGLEVEQDSGNIDKTQSKATHNEPSSSGISSGSGLRRQETMGDTIAQTRSENVSKHSKDPLLKATPNEAGSQGTTSGGGPRCQETMGDTISQTRFENVYKLSNDPLLARGNTLQSGEDSLKLKELMELCTNLQQRVLALENTKTTQAEEIDSLKRRVKKLEKKKRSRTHKLKRLYKVSLSARVESSGDEEDLGEDASKQGRRIHDIVVNEDITLVNDDNEIFDVDALAGKEVFVAEQSENVVEEVVDVAQTITTEEITLAKALADLKSTKPKAKGNVLKEPGESTTKTTPIPSKIQDKGKGKMVEPEPVKKLSKKDQLKLDEEIALKLQAEIDEDSKKAEIELEDNLKKAEAKVMEGGSKRTGEELEQESIKKQKVDEDKETTELQSLMVFSQMLKSYDRQDLEDLYKLVKAKYGSTRLVEDLDLILYGYLKTIVHSLRMQHVYIHMLVEKRYPLTPSIIIDMLNKKLQLSMKKLEILKKNIKIRGGLLGLKDFLMILELLLLSYYCSKIKTAERVSTVRERILTEERIKIVWRSRLLT
ncbi:hypothetical protein Tco_0386830 [Tanacetum coccineum]